MIEIIKAEFRKRLIDEGLFRITKCVDELNDEQLWYRHNDNTNPIGNIVLHLCGNVRQYIEAGINLSPDIRNRSEEFLISSKMDRVELLQNISKVVHDANAVVQSLSIEDLEKKRIVQGFDHTVLSIIIHVIEHFSYHVGQITFFTKFVNDIDTGYYAGVDLDT